MPTDSRALELWASLILEDERRLGGAAVEVQWIDARAVLNPDLPTPYHFLTRARGFSKTADVAGYCVALMLEQLPQGSRLYALAADQEQGRLFVDSIEGFALRTPELTGALRIDNYRVTAIANGSTLEVLPADAPGAWGLRPAFVAVDEIGNWAETPSAKRLWDAVATATAKMSGCRLALITTASSPAHFSAEILRHAEADPLWRVNQVPGPPPWMDSARLEEQRRRLPESTFRRLFMNEWVSGEDALGKYEDIEACATLDGPQDPRRGVGYALGLDIGVKRDPTALAIVHKRTLSPRLSEENQPEVQVMVDRIQVWKPRPLRQVDLSEVEQTVIHAWRSYNRPTVILDPWQALGMAQRLRRRGVRVEEFSFSSSNIGRLATTLHLLIRERNLAIPRDKELIEELANIELRETSPGVFRVDHQPGRHDDRAIAIGMAALHLLSRRESPHLRLGTYSFNSRTRQPAPIILESHEDDFDYPSGEQRQIASGIARLDNPPRQGLRR